MCYDGTEFWIAFLPQKAKRFYNRGDSQLPPNYNEGTVHLANQKLNAYLKEIADCCGICKNLTYHIARHTFVTTITLSSGVPIEPVLKMLGHKNPRTTQHYAKISDHKISMLEDLIKIASSEPYKSSGGMRIKEILIQPRKSPEAKFIFEIWTVSVGLIN